MKYKILDTFSVRTPFNPLETYQKYLVSEDTKEETLNLFEKDWIKEAIQVSSYSLYSSLVEEKGDPQKLRIGFQNYLSRMSTRTTPFGFLAGVGLGTFSDESRENKITYQKSIRPDTEWLFEVIKKIENYNRGRLYLSWNTGTTLLASKYCNEWNTCLMNEERKVRGASSQSYINNTNAVKIIEENSQEFISTLELIKILRKAYPQVNEDVFTSFIDELANKEFLISDVRGTPLCHDKFGELLKVIDERKYEMPDNYLATLKKLKQDLHDYNHTDFGKGIELYNEIISDMKKIVVSDNYIHADMFTDDRVHLKNNVKKDLVDFVGFLSTMAGTNLFQEMKVWEDRFIERYSFTEQLLLDVINPIKGIGLPIGRRETDNFGGIDDFQKELIFNVQQCINNSEDSIELAKFSSYLDKKVKSHPMDSQELELALFILKNLDQKVQYVVSPVGGENAIGSILGRFARNFEDQHEAMDRLDDENDYDGVEIIFYPQVSRLANILNTSTKHKYILEFGSKTQLEGLEILKLSDIVVNVLQEGIYFKNKKTSRRLKFFSTNALRNDLTPPLVQFLLNCRIYKQPNLFSLFYKLSYLSNSFAIIPRIVYKNIIVKEKQWSLNSTKLKNLGEKEFIEEFSSYAKTFKMDRFVFLQEFDKRVLIDIENKDNQKFIYNSFKKNNNITFLENLFSNARMLVENNRGQPLISEYIFSFKSVNENFNNQIKKRSFQPILKIPSEFTPFQEYIYLKIYTAEIFEEELITQYIIPFAEKSMANGDLERFFYIRYHDGQSHLRIRFKLIQANEINNKFLTRLIETLEAIKVKGYTSNIQYDTFIPETKRYGGELVYNEIEHFFYLNSKVTAQLLNLYKLGKGSIKKTEIAIIAICKLLLDTNMGWEKAIKLIEKNTIKNRFKKEFREEKQKFMDLLLNKDRDYYRELYLILEQQSECLQKMWISINENEEKLPTSKEDIIGSLLHMFCNRFFGADREKELYVLNISSKTLYAVYMFQKATKSDKIVQGLKESEKDE